MYPEHLQKFIPPEFDLAKYDSADMSLSDWAYSLSMRSGLKMEVLDEHLDEYTTTNLKEGAVARKDIDEHHIRTDETISVVREITCYQVLAMGDQLNEQMEAKSLYSAMKKKDLFHRDKESPLNKYISSEIGSHYDWLTAEPLWLEVDLSCSEKEIKIAFETWLKKKMDERKNQSDRKRREYKLKEFSEATLRRWHDSRVLAYLDLEAWNYLQGNKVTSKQYGDILFPEYKNQRDNTQYVNDTLKPLAEHLTDGDLHMRMRKIYIDTNRQK